MADQPSKAPTPEKKKRGSQPNRQDTESFSITLPLRLYRYVIWLATHSHWGPTEQDVVVKILTREIDAMFDRGYHDKRHPGE